MNMKQTLGWGSYFVMAIEFGLYTGLLKLGEVLVKIAQF